MFLFSVTYMEKDMMLTCKQVCNATEIKLGSRFQPLVIILNIILVELISTQSSNNSQMQKPGRNKQKYSTPNKRRKKKRIILNVEQVPWEDQYVYFLKIINKKGKFIDTHI